MRMISFFMNSIIALILAMKTIKKSLCNLRFSNEMIIIG